MKKPTPEGGVPGWDRLSHGGLLLDPARLHALSRFPPKPLPTHTESVLRKRANAVLDRSGDIPDFVTFTLEEVCGFRPPRGNWTRGSRVPAGESRKAVTGETVRPRQLWTGPRGARLPVFFDENRRLGIGRGRRVASRVFGWLRTGGEPLALLTNGREWRLLFAGLDYEAWCQWDLDLWFEEGELSPQVTALRTLLSPELWIPETEGATAKLLAAIRDSRKGQAELSETLGERVREAVEVLIRGHGEALREQCPQVAPTDIYRAACRVAMRLVVILFAEARDLLPRDNALYDASYSLNGLYERLDRAALRGGLGNDFAAWPRVLALFRLVREGSHHPELPVPDYGGELFADADAEDGVARALAVFETACLEKEVYSDRDVHKMLRLLTRTTVRIRQGRAGTRAPVPVDFSDLSSEYIGVLYEGLLDYELKSAPPDDPVVFVAVGDQAALPLGRLEAMDDGELKKLFEKLKPDKKEADAGSDGEPADAGTVEDDVEEDEEEGPELKAAVEPDSDAPPDDPHRHQVERATAWARRVVAAAGLVRKPRGRDTRNRHLANEDKLEAQAKKFVARVVPPGEWYLVRWGGTRKGSGTFYTRPGLAVPTVHRTLRPLAYEPPQAADGSPDGDAPTARWTPKRPESILALTVCDPACGSGTFPLVALRFLTDTLYASLQHHGRLRPDGERTLVRVLGISPDSDPEDLREETIPCPPDHDDFEPRLRAVLRRYVVERCIYAVDLDPLAVELCRLSLWIETMDRNLPFGFLDHKIKCGNALVGAWFDQFRHYPAMAWKDREGGDKNHTNGVHFGKEARTKALKAFVKNKLKPDLQLFLLGPGVIAKENWLADTATAHAEAFSVLAKCHALPIGDVGARARMYREDFRGSEAWRSLREAMDLWCACWFWPTDEIEAAPLPTKFSDAPPETRAVAARVAAEMRFLHWELEFPDVFREPGSGFDAVLGNPPWEIAKPNSMEFFSNLDPLYRSYGKQEAKAKQTDYFGDDAAVERDWLDYCGHFRAQSNFAGRVASPFGDPMAHEKLFFSIKRGNANAALHERWRNARDQSVGYADPAHPFRHQGSADLNLYKLFLEAAHAVLRPGGRLGFLVPSGLYSDHGTRALRDLFLERCRWEWLFGVENRDRIFPIHRSYKFNPIVVQKHGTTKAIQTAFMQRNPDDWARAEEIATPYTRAQITQFSPKSRSILEIQSKRDLEVLEKIYANAVLLGDSGPDGWGIRYACEFHMTNDSRLFPPQQEWEAKRYRPDEYGRWLQGDWRPIEELWAESRVNPARPEPTGVELKGWLFEESAGPERREAQACLLHGHVLKPGDMVRTGWQSRCAQPPYDHLPVPRVSIPEGVILSRAADAYMREDGGITDMALPLYEGRMIGQFDFSKKGWVSGKGRSAVWRAIPWGWKQIEAQFLMAEEDCRVRVPDVWKPRVMHMQTGSATNTRTAIGALKCGTPAGHKTPTLEPAGDVLSVALAGAYNSWVFGYVLRMRLVGLSIDYYVLEQMPLFGRAEAVRFAEATLPAIQSLSSSPWLAPIWIGAKTIKRDGFIRAALTPAERLRVRATLDAIVALWFGLDHSDLRHILKDSDLPRGEIGNGSLNPKGFWRIDKDKEPELRQTVLTVVALHDLEKKIALAGADRKRGVEAFLHQNHGEGWMLPETLRLADYGLGHDDRARHPQPVASRLGPRFFDWQLTQTPEESWRECHLHARNLLGEHRYHRLLEDIQSKDADYTPEDTTLPRVAEPESLYRPPATKSPKPGKLL